MPTDEQNPTEPTEDVPSVDAAASSSDVPSAADANEAPPATESIAREEAAAAAVNQADDSERATPSEPEPTEAATGEVTSETAEAPAVASEEVAAPVGPKKKRSAKKKKSPRKRSKSTRSRAKEEVDESEPQVAPPAPPSSRVDAMRAFEKLEGVPSASDETADADSNSLADLLAAPSDAPTTSETTESLAAGLVAAIAEPAASASGATSAEESDAFPFLEGGSSEPDHAGDDIVAQAVREALENGGTSGEDDASDPTAAEIAAMASDPVTESAIAAPAVETIASGSAPSETPAPRASRISRFLAVAKKKLPASFKRTAVRSLAACVLAIAAGFGYGAAVRTFFGGKSADLREENQSAQHDVESSEPKNHETHLASDTIDPHTEAQQGADEGHGTASNDGVIPAHAPATVDGSASSESAAHTKPIANSSEKFEMPALDSSLPRTDHALGIGRQRLKEGDVLAARRIATAFLLREDALTAEDRLLVPQAYALLADSLKVEWDRKHPKSKESAELLALPAAAPSVEQDSAASEPSGEPMPTVDADGAEHDGGER